MRGSRPRTNIRVTRGQFYQLIGNRVVISSSKRPYGLTCSQISGVSARRSVSVSFDDYLVERTALLQKKSRAAGAAPESVWTTFTLALDRVIAGDPRTNTAACPEAERLLGLLSMLAPDDIPLDLIGKDVMSGIERGEAIAALAEVSLITRLTLDDDSFGVSVHRLVQDVMRGRLAQAGALSGVAAKATELLAETFPSSYDGSQQSMAVRDRLVPHVLAALAHAPEAGAGAAAAGYLRSEIGDWRAERGDGKGALENYRRSLVIAEKLAADRPERPQTQTDLVVTYFKLADAGVDPKGNLTKAHVILKRLVEQGVLTANQQGWIGIIETQLAGLSGTATSPPKSKGEARKTAETRPGFLTRFFGRKS